MTTIRELEEMRPGLQRGESVVDFVVDKAVSYGETSFSSVELIIYRAFDFDFNALGGMKGFFFNRLLNDPGIFSYDYALRAVGATTLADVVAKYVNGVAKRAHGMGIDLDLARAQGGLRPNPIEQFQALRGPDAETEAVDEELLPLLSDLDNRIAAYAEAHVRDVIGANSVG